MRTAPVPPPIDTDITRSVGLGCPTESDVGPAWSQSQNAAFIRPQTAPEISEVLAGSFIAFQFDEGYAKDKKTFFPLGRYIGLVVASDVYKSGDDGRWNEELTVKFVARGPPEIEGCKKHYMPIASSSSDVGETPLKTNDLLPRPNIVQWTTFGARLHIRMLHDDPNSLKFALQDDELERFEDRAGRTRKLLPGFPSRGKAIHLRSHCLSLRGLDEHPRNTVE
ncbi:hypothetical protein A0H81_11257 [Grifola frondosa]|uniref:Uncharacterized protein n=1 Tax=Grifola frondosa TaxID=5627 RepID=A0A1C7LV41_GRIFR|nr:hypothetical protein A0H81_11257 [Grifola frondosa]